MSLVQLLMTTAAKSTPFIALYCKSESVPLPRYYEARMMATRLSKRNDLDRAAGPAPEDERGYLR